MDAPPPQEDVRPFVQVATAMGDAGLNGPRVLESDPVQGFLLLSDLGSELYLGALQQADAARGRCVDARRHRRAVALATAHAGGVAAAL